MSKTMTLNGKTYDLPDFNFEEVCELEEMGFSVSLFTSKPISQALIFTMYVTGCDKDEAAKEIMAHINKEGDLADIFDAIGTCVKNSDFFTKSGMNRNRAQRRAAKKKAPTQEA